MRYAIISDLHSNIEALESVLEYADKIGVDKYICLGDVVGYNACPKEVLDRLRGLNPVAVIKGNHDEYVSQTGELTGFNPQAAQAVEWTRRQLSEEDRRWLAALPLTKNLWQLKTTLVHSTLDSPDAWGYIFDKYYAENSFAYQRLPFCFIGHSHVPFAYEQIGGAKGTIQAGRYEEIKLNPSHKYLINVGSVGQPRDGDPRSAFVTYDDDDRIIRLHRVEYDIQKAQQRILKAGLPERLALRLAVGR
jgi:diadenosine tetraphosphatase ApaH/serine/threonine PP2A family protein phosphatase